MELGCPVTSKADYITGMNADAYKQLLNWICLWGRRFLLPTLFGSLMACSPVGFMTTKSDAGVSLSDMSIEALRAREYGSTLRLIEELGDKCARPVTDDTKDRSSYRSYMAGYTSDGLDLFTRMDIPDGSSPENGFPVVVFAHGWVGIDDAPDYHFGCSETSIYGDAIDAYTRAGFVVLSPGYRGHGNVKGVSADGIWDMQKWDNGSYLMPSFYAIDVINLIGGLPSIERLELPDMEGRQVSIDKDRLYLTGHSQGGDVALTVLAATGEEAKSGIDISAASIWSGNIPDRFTQLETFYPMQVTPDAFMSGDGTWTGSATGQNGEINSNFVFGYPPAWIGTTDQSEWTWQKESWSKASVKEALEIKYTQMYDTVNTHLDDADDAEFSIVETSSGLQLTHDERIVQGMSHIGGYNKVGFLKETLALHFSDRDFYSLPRWNKDLCDRINRTQGHCMAFEYPGNTHLLTASEHAWFSPQGTVPGYEYLIRRDIELFSGKDPEDIPYP